jgi:hypothetical protein
MHTFCKSSNHEEEDCKETSACCGCRLTTPTVDEVGANERDDEAPSIEDNIDFQLSMGICTSQRTRNVRTSEIQ